MPTDTYPVDSPRPDRYHWYTRVPPRPPRRRRYGSSVVNNVWNAWSNWNNAVQGNSAGLLATMRTQVDNLKSMIDASSLAPTQKPLVQQLIVETKGALDSLNPALLSQQASRTSSVPMMQRTASEQSAISSNAKAALGCMAYLQDDNLFPECATVYQYVRERLEQIFRLMDGEYQVGDVLGARQQGQTALQQVVSTAVAPDGSMPPYMPPSAGTTAPYPSPPNATQAQGYGPATAAPSTSGGRQTPAPSPTAGLKAEPTPWDGTPNTTFEGDETVGSRQDWFSTYGITLEQFAARCARWLQANGGGQVALAEHLRQCGVPDNVIAQTLPYI